MNAETKQLENKIENISMDDIENQLVNRKFTMCLSYFEGKRDLRNVKRIFYYYDGGSRKNTNIEFLFKNDKYIVVRTEGGFKHCMTVPYHNVFVIGFDEYGRPFTHLLPEYYGKPEVDEEWINNEMDFDSDDKKDLSEGKRVRVQGDVVLSLDELCFDFDDWIEHNWKSELLKIERDLKKEVLTEMNGVKYEHWHATVSDSVLYQEEYGKALLRHRDISYDNTIKLKQEIAIEEKIKPHHVSLSRVEEEISRRAKKDARAIAEPIFDKLYRKKVLAINFNQRKEEYRQKLLSSGKQKNRILGNHLIIAENCISVNHSGYTIVYGKCKFNIIHNYHSDCELDLESGRYIIHTLRRNEKDVSRDTTFDIGILRSRKSKTLVECYNLPSLSYREPNPLEELRDWMESYSELFTLSDNSLLVVLAYNIRDYVKGGKDYYNILVDEMYVLSYHNRKLMINQVNLPKPIVLNKKGLDVITSLDRDTSD